MSDTPISDSTPHNVAELGMLCRRLERELTASNAIIRQQQLLDEENLRLQERIKRLEEALESIQEYWNRDNNETAMENACWHAIDTAAEALEAKEAKL
jgi:DNA-binding transcriptional MerR regulator